MDEYYGVPIIRNSVQKIVFPKNIELEGFHCTVVSGIYRLDFHIIWNFILSRISYFSMIVLFCVQVVIEDHSDDLQDAIRNTSALRNPCSIFTHSFL